MGAGSAWLLCWALAASIVTLLSPAPAEAGFTSPVPELAERLETAWQADAACPFQTVDDLVAQPVPPTLFVVADDRSQIRITSEAGGDCRTNGWSVSAAVPACARVACDLLTSDPHLVSGLHDAIRAPSMPGVMQQSVRPERPRTTRVSFIVVWRLLACLAALLGGTILAVAGGRPARWHLWLAGIALVGLALRLWVTHRLPLHNDELIGWGVVNLWDHINNRDLPQNPPMYRLLAWPLALLSNGSPHQLRWVSVVVGTLAVWMVGLAGRELGGDRAGLAAALITAAHQNLVLVSSVNRAYSALALFAAATVCVVAGAVSSGRARHRYAASLLACAMVLSHWWGFIVAFAIIAWIATDRESGGIRLWSGPIETGFLLLLPFLLLPLAGALNKIAVILPEGGLAPVARGIAMSAPAAVTGVGSALLEGRMPAPPGWLFTAVTGLLLIVLLLARPKPQRALLAWIIGATWLLPALAALWLVTVREVQMVAAMVAFSLVGGLVCARAGARWLAIALAAGLALGAATVSAHLERPPPTRVQELASWVEAQDDGLPTHINGWPAFVRVARSLGLSADEVAESYAGAHSRVRLLRSCSASAVRSAGGGEVRSLRIGFVHESDRQPCDALALSGRGVTCRDLPSAMSGVGTVTCELDPSVPWIDPWDAAGMEAFHPPR